MATLHEITKTHQFAVLEHLEAEAQVPVLSGLQAQGDLLIVPLEHANPIDGSWTPDAVPAAGIPVIEAVGAGHEHRLFAGTPGTATFGFLAPGLSGADIGVVHCDEPVFLLHPEHGATGLAPGSYMLRRQREQAAEERLVAD